MYYPLYLVISSDDCNGANFISVAEEAILGGVDIIQLREKNKSTHEFIDLAFQLKKVTDAYKVPLIINDNLEVAMAVDAAGIHVGNNDISPIKIREKWPNKIIGYSIEYIEQLQNEATQYADYIAASPVFSTLTKKDTITEWGLEGVQKIKSISSKPLVAIGNLNLKNCAAVVQSGADSIAVVSAICKAEDPQTAATQLKTEILKALHS